MRRLIIRPGAIGDFLLALPAMEALDAAYVELWAASANLPLARFAHKTRAIASTGLDLLELPGGNPEVLDRLAAFDSIVSWYGASRPEFREAVVAAGLPFHFFPALPPDGYRRHATEFYLEQAAILGVAPRRSIPRLDCPGEPGRAVVIHPFSGSRRKNWPLDRFQELARRLETVMPVLWCAGPEEELEGAIRFDDLYGLACWLRRARVYIGNDSGITHLAAAAGTRVVALFGPSDPAVWAPRGSNVRVVAPETPGHPMDVVSINGVEAAVYAAIGDSH